MFSPKKVQGIPVLQSVPCNKHVMLMGKVKLQGLWVYMQFP